jgi:hypothetical protein
LKRLRIDFPENVQFVESDSVASGTVAQVQDLCGGQGTMLLADGNHAADHVFQELAVYGPMVAPGCYFIVDDGIVDVMDWPQYQPGPLVAVQRFLAKNSSFIADELCEKIYPYLPAMPIPEARRQVAENIQKAVVTCGESVTGGGPRGRVSSRVEDEKLVRSPRYCVRFVCAG